MFAVSKFVASIAVAASAIGASSHAQASTYDFSYNFGSYGPGEITGSFTGTGPITDVTGISDISASFDSTSIGSPLYAYHYTGPSAGPNCPTCFSSGGAVASTTLPNNFLFSTASTVPALLTGNYAWFYIIPWVNGGPGSTTEAVQYYNPPNFVPSNQYNGDYFAANFTLTETPLPSTWTMLIAGFIGLGFVAYQGTKKDTAAIAVG
jgi:hypothetical protein